MLRIRKDRTAHDSRSAPLPKPVFLWHAMQNDIDIFRGIKSEIQKNPENFKPAGQWLDGYCQNVIKKAKQHRKNLPQIISEKQKEAKRIKGLHGKTRKEISKLKDKSEINEQEEEKLSGLVAKANQLSLKVYDLKRELEHLKGKSQDEPGFIQLMSKAFEKASCEYPRNHIKIMVIVWLLTDEYLSESKLGITKYEQYVFHHEVREPEGNGPQRLVSEQEMAKDAVLARPGAMEKIRDAYLSYENSSGKAGNDEAYIPFTKAIKLSNGILNRKKLDKAIKQRKPIKVRSKKPTRNRQNVHIQDVLLLIENLSENTKATEEATSMFGEYKNLLQKKMSKQTNLD